jgi:hypothetical protein
MTRFAYHLRIHLERKKESGNTKNALSEVVLKTKFMLRGDTGQSEVLTSDWPIRGAHQ